MSEHVVGVDLSGPASPHNTVAVAFELQRSTLGTPQMELLGASDSRICEGVAELLDDGPVTVGVDAPLSYNPGGSDRPGDKKLRDRLKKDGMYHSAAVMCPTMTRMAYLTLRGVALTRMLEQELPEVHLSIVEVHPGASMALSEAPEALLKGSRSGGKSVALEDLTEWLGRSDVNIDGAVESRHHLDAIACAVAAHDWVTGDFRWLHPADPPVHPYDFVC